MDRVLTGQGDLAYTLSFEILPSIAVTDLSALGTRARGRGGER